MAVVAIAFCTPQVQAQQSRNERLRSHLYTLADDNMQGRNAGSEGGAKARQYIIGQYQHIGLQPYGDSLTHTFTRQTYLTSLTTAFPLQNIVAIIPGNDPLLKDEYIVLGAHYDHLGIKNDQIYNGADDNASGTTAIIEIARELYAHRSELKRSVIIAAFDAEEEGLCGSRALVDEMRANGDLGKVKLMMSIDMVGWYGSSGQLTMQGCGTLLNADDIMKRTAEAVGLNINLKRFEHSILTATDTEPFAKAQCPTLAVSTGLKSPYHKPEDDADLIDYEGLDLVCQYLTQMTLDWANGSQPLTSSQRVAKKHTNKTARVEIGVGGAIGNAQLRYPESALLGKSCTSGMLGVSGRWNMAKHVALQADAYLSLYRLQYPNLNGGVLDVFSSKEYKTFANVTIPLTLLVSNNTRSSANVYFGAGVFFSPMLNPDGKLQNNFLAGPQWRIGFRFGSIEISSISMYNLYHANSNPLPHTHSVHIHAALTIYL